METVTSSPTKNTIVRLDKGDPVIASLRDIARQEDIVSGKVSGVGAVEQATIGYYRRKQKEYKKDVFEKPHELTNLTGMITCSDGDVHIHAHATLADENHNAFGGHLHAAEIAAAGEFWIQHTDTEVKRRHDDSLGLNLMQLS